MAMQLDEGGRTGGSMPSKKERDDLKRYAQELKLSASSWSQQHKQWEQEGEAKARARIAKVLHDAKAKGDRRRVASILQAMAGKAQADAEVLHQQLEMMKWHMVVDALSVIDPTPISDGVSIWMDVQQAGQ
jgi:hypothetical protein